MKNTYIAISVKEENKHFAYVLKVSNSDNLIYQLKIKGIECANICESKKKAEETVSIWNDSYKNNGTYAFS